MIDVRVLLLSAVAITASIRPGEAGACTTELDQLQAQLDAHVGATASTVPFGQESIAAKLHHQPTPGSLAHAEERLGNVPDLRKAVTALQRARDLDRAGEVAECQVAVVEVRHALGD